MTPPTLKGREFEELLLAGAARCPAITMSRYGVQTMVGKDGKLLAVPSLPDFEGVAAPDGWQFIIEAKVSASASFPLEPGKIKPRQVRHLLDRSRYGVACFVLIHWCERRGKTFHEPAETIALPVCERLTFWQEFLDAAAEAKRSKNPFKSPGSISREYAAKIGQRVEWTCPKGSRKHLPDLAALLGIQTDDPSLF
jgi:penicillin-binding protein-related factor A (putative recombinase)